MDLELLNELILDESQLETRFFDSKNILQTFQQLFGKPFPQDTSPTLE